METNDENKERTVIHSIERERCIEKIDALIKLCMHRRRSKPHSLDLFFHIQSQTEGNK